MTAGSVSDVVLVVDKPSGPTSFDVVRQVRRAARTRHVGHGGTLDPLASGVLPICLGEATKLAPFLLDADKAYEATLRLGVETDTDDSAGSELAVAIPPASMPERSKRRWRRFAVRSIKCRRLLGHQACGPSPLRLRPRG